MLFTYQRVTLQTRPAAVETGVRMAETNTVNAARYPYVDCKTLKSKADKEDNVQRRADDWNTDVFSKLHQNTLLSQFKHVHMIEKKEPTHQQPQTTLAAH
jgi:hypothetical protein